MCCWWAIRSAWPCRGQASTLPVHLQDMCYHTSAVARGSKEAMIVADLPFGAYQQSKEQAFAAAAELMAAGAHMVKLEGGVWMAETTEFLQLRGIPVCAHIGLTPQSVHAFGGYRVQGKGDKAAALMNDAKAHDEAGAAIVLMECVRRKGPPRHRKPALPHHRHRRRRGLRRPSAGDARHAGRVSRQNRQIREKLYAGANQHTGGGESLCGCGERPLFSGSRTHIQRIRRIICSANIFRRPFLSLRPSEKRLPISFYGFSNHANHSQH